MADKVLPELRAELGADVAAAGVIEKELLSPALALGAALAKLNATEQARLLDLIHDARKRQHQTIKAAMGGALEIVPALLRGPIRAFFKH